MARKYGLVVLGLIAAGLIAASLPAFGQDADAGEDATPEKGARIAEHRDDFAAELAEELDLPEERVAEALDNVHERNLAEMKAAHRERLVERLDEAVADGDLTREQADAVLAAHDAGIFPRGGPHMEMRRGSARPGHGPRYHIDDPESGESASQTEPADA